MKTYPRPPVVVVLGHVDHGKTTLLDYIRKTNIAKKEYGGITQKIGAYEVLLNISGYPINKITFIDTPGHEVFSKLRSRGAEVADIAVLIVDACDSVMPQTIESFYHIKNAKIPFIVAANKIDLPSANPQKVKRDLAKHNVLVEGMGGNIPFVTISAKTGQGVNDLLELILFIASEKNLSYSPQNPLSAYIIEAKKEKAGITVSAIIKDGCLKVGEVIYALDKKCKIRALINDRGQFLKEVFPSTPFVLLGFEKLPEVGVELTREEKREEKKATILKEDVSSKTIDDWLKKTEEKKLFLIVKADSYGSLEAIISQISSFKNLEIVMASVGEITRSDLFLAKAAKAIIIAFNVPVTKKIFELAKEEKVIIKSYSLIYEIIEEIKEAVSFLKEKKEQIAKIKGEAKILANFIIEGERIAGVKVIQGKISLGDQVEIYRGERLLGRAKIVSLKQKAKKVETVCKNEEAGMIFSPPLDFSIGDMVKSYSI